LAALALVASVRDADKKKGAKLASILSHNGCNREANGVKNAVEQKLIYLTRGGQDGT
jgi:hypothetical protein